MLNKMNMQISLGQALHLWEAEANKWILNKETAQAIQLRLISPPPLSGSTHQCAPLSPAGACFLKGWMKEAAEAWAGMRSRLGLVRVFPLRSLIPIPVATVAGRYDAISGTCHLEPRGLRADRQWGRGGGCAHMAVGELRADEGWRERGWLWELTGPGVGGRC